MLLERTLENAAIAALASYLVIGCIFLFFLGIPTGKALLVMLIPALLVGLMVSGYLTVIVGPNGIRFVDPRRTPAQMADARASLEARQIDDQPQFNVDGTPMCGAVDVNGNPYGVTNHHH